MNSNIDAEVVEITILGCADPNNCNILWFLAFLVAFAASRPAKNLIQLVLRQTGPDPQRFHQVRVAPLEGTGPDPKNLITLGADPNNCNILWFLAFLVAFAVSRPAKNLIKLVLRQTGPDPQRFHQVRVAPLEGTGPDPDGPHRR